jgi:hypothetical protein
MELKSLYMTFKLFIHFILLDDIPVSLPCIFPYEKSSPTAMYTFLVTSSCLSCLFQPWFLMFNVFHIKLEC